MKYKAQYAPLMLIGLMLIMLLGQGTVQSTFGQEIVVQQQTVNLTDCLGIAVPHVDVGNLPAVFMLDEAGERFARTSSYAGAVEVSSRGSVTLQANETAALSAAQVEISFVMAKEANATVSRDATQSPTVTVLDVDGDAQHVKTTDTIALGDIAVQGSNRRLTFEAQKQPYRGYISLGLSVATDGKVTLDEQGNLETTSSDSELADRSLTWDVRATQTVRGRTTLVNAYFVKNRAQQFDVRLTGAFNSKLPVDLVITTLYGDHLPVTEAVVTPNGETIAVTDSMDGVVLTRLSGRDKQISSLTYIQGDALQVNDVAMGQKETVLVAGTIQNGRTTAMTLLQLSPDLTQISQKFDGRTSGLSTGISVVQMDDGQIVAIGEAADGVKTERPVSTPITLMLPTSPSSPKTTRLIVVDLAPSMNGTNGVTVLNVPEIALQAISLIDCKEYLIIGPGIGTVSAVMASETYSADIDQAGMDACPEIDHGYGAGLICWKAVRASDYNYTPAPALSNYPQGGVTATDYQVLNNIEDNDYGNVFFDNVSSTWKNPSGSWQGENNWAYNKVELALGAALYHTRWGSPIGANMNHNVGGSSGVQAVMITDVTFSADDSDDLPHNICPNFSLDGDYEPEYQVATNCFNNFSGGMVLDSVDFDAWVGGSYTPNHSVSGSDNSWFPSFTPYAGDPPEDDPAQAAVILEMSRQMSPYVYVMNPITIYEVQNGDVKLMGQTTLPVQAIMLP